MSGNGGDNAHNNQFGGGGRGPTGGVQGGPTGLGNGGGGQGGNWGWKYDPGTSGGPTRYDPDGSPRITIDGGWKRVPMDGNGNGGDTNAPTGGGGNPTGNPSQQPAFGPDGQFTAYVDGFTYHVTLDGSGNATGVTRTAEPERTFTEKLQIGVAESHGVKPEEMFPTLNREASEPLRQERAKQQAEQAWRSLPENSRSFDVNIDGYGYNVKVDEQGVAAGVTRTSEPERDLAEKLKIAQAEQAGRRPEEMFPELDRSPGEPGRQTRAKQQAEQQWKQLPGNIRNFDVDVDGFGYQVNVNNLGEVQSVQLNREPERTFTEKLKIGQANAAGRKPEEMFPELDRSPGEPGRQERAKQQAVAQFMSSPVNQARIKRAEELRRKEEELRKQQEAENQRREEDRKRAEEARQKLETERKAAEDRLRSTAVMAVRGFPATDAVSLAPVRYSVAGICSDAQSGSL